MMAASATGATKQEARRNLRAARPPRHLPSEIHGFFSTFWRRGRYYRTYPAYVEDEVRVALASQADFVRGPRNLSKRGTADDDTHAFVVEVGRYMSGRWPGDAYLLAKKLIERLASVTARISA